VTMYTTDGILHRRTARDDVVHEVTVAAQTVFLRDDQVLGLDQDGLVEVLQREALGMPESMICFGEILREKRVRQVAVDTRRASMVRPLRPGIVLLVHDVAVLASGRIR